MQVMKFSAENVYYAVEDEILTVAFADSMSPDPNNYLILQREIDGSETYYYTVNSQHYSNDGGFKAVEILPNQLIIDFLPTETIYKDGFKCLVIEFNPDKKLNDWLEKMF